MNILFLKKYTHLFSAIVVMMTFMFHNTVAMDESYKNKCRDKTIGLLNTSKDSENNLTFDRFQAALTSVLEFYKKEAESKKLIDTPLKNKSDEKTNHYWLFHGITVEGFYQFTLENVNALSREYGKINIDIPKSELDRFFTNLGEYDSELVSNHLNVNLIKLAVDKINKILIPKSTTEKRFDDFKKSFREKSAPKKSEPNENLSSSIATLSLEKGSNGNLGINVPDDAELNLLLNMSEKGKVLVGTRVTNKNGDIVQTSLVNMSPKPNDSDSQEGDYGSHSVDNGLCKLMPNLIKVEEGDEGVKVEEVDEELESLLSQFLPDPDFDTNDKLVVKQKPVKAESKIEVQKSSRFTKYIKYALGGAIFLVCLYCNLQ